MTIDISRRGLLLGIGSLIVAPSIVRASSLMPIKIMDPYFYRYMSCYCIGTDVIIERIDKALFPLPIQKGMIETKIITAKDLKNYVFGEKMRNLEVSPNHQKNIQWIRPYSKND